MKIALLLIWLATPIGWLSWHYGPGQEALKLDASDRAVKKALAATDAENQFKAWDAAVGALPKSATAQARRLRLARCETLVGNRQLPQARKELEALYGEMKDDPAVEAAEIEPVQEQLASAKYYTTWLMRLEGLPQEEWEPEVESARQHFRLLAEKSSVGKDRYQEKLESAIRLARMDLTELQGLPLPGCCKGCCSGKCKSQAKKPPEKKSTDSRSAGGNQMVDSEGS
jgi:predicted negative regulator of RcsB-dependent stress response